jgi:hypothetical protein
MLVAARAHAHVAGIDPVLVQGTRALRVIGQQLVTVVMEVADNGDPATRVTHALDEFSYGPCGLARVDRNANEFGTRLTQRHHLGGGGLGVRRVGIRHGLHDDLRPAADGNMTHSYLNGLMSLHIRHNTRLRASMPILA